MIRTWRAWSALPLRYASYRKTCLLTLRRGAGNGPDPPPFRPWCRSRGPPSCSGWSILTVHSWTPWRCPSEGRSPLLSATSPHTFLAACGRRGGRRGSDAGRRVCGRGAGVVGSRAAPIRCSHCEGAHAPDAARDVIRDLIRPTLIGDAGEKTYSFRSRPNQRKGNRHGRRTRRVQYSGILRAASDQPGRPLQLLEGGHWPALHDGGEPAQNLTARQPPTGAAIGKPPPWERPQQTSPAKPPREKPRRLWERSGAGEG